MGHPTLKDVAARAGVHPGTASRALDPTLRGRVAATTSARVAEAARELGYVADPVARSLRTQRSGIIGVLVPDLTNPFFPPLLRGVEEALRAEGFEAVIASTDNDVRREATLVEVLQHRRCDGYILATAVRKDPVVDTMVARGTPLVLVNRLAESPAPSVVSDDAIGIAQAVRHLHGLGHRAIAHVTGPTKLSVTVLRERAFRDAMRAVGLRGRPTVVRATDYTAEAGAEACTRLLDELEATAVLAGNDMLALGCYAALEGRGLRCPDDVSVVGINDMPLAGWLHPPLTTVAVPQYELGTQAALLLLERLRDPETDRDHTVVPTTFVVRGSTSPAPTRPTAGTRTDAGRPDDDKQRIQLPRG